MVTLLSTTAFGGGRSPSPVSPVFVRSGNPSPPHSPARDVSPLTPSLSTKPWVNNSHAPSPIVSEGVPSPVIIPETVPESPSTGGPIAVVIPPRMDSITQKPPALDGDQHYKQTAPKYACRPLPRPPVSVVAPAAATATAFPPRSASIAKPWVDHTESRPATPPWSTHSSPKYSLFPSTNSPGSNRFPATPPKSANSPVSSPVNRFRSVSPSRSGITARRPDISLDTAVPRIREHRSNTEPHIVPPPNAMDWPERLSSAARTQTVPIECHGGPPSRPSVSVPPTLRRPSAVEVLVRREVGASSMIRAGPGHQFQLAHTHHDIEGQRAVKWIKKSDKMRKKSATLDRQRSVSAIGIPEEHVPKPSLAMTPSSRPKTSRSQSPQRMQLYELEAPDSTPSLVPKAVSPFKPSWSGFSEPRSAGIPLPSSSDRGQDPKGLNLGGINLKGQDPNGQEVPTLERGRSLRRQNVPTPLALAEPEAHTIQIIAPSPQQQKHLPPPARGPLDLRASAFKPFSPELDPDALEAFFAVRGRDPPSVAAAAAMPARKPVPKKEQRYEAAKFDDGNAIRTIEQITEMVEAEEERWKKDKELREAQRRQHQQHQQPRKPSASHHRRQNPEIGIPPGGADFLQAKPLPAPPSDRSHLDSPGSSAARAPSPLAKLARMVK